MYNNIIMKTDNLSRENFNELYDAVIHDILMLKDCNINVKQIMKLKRIR